MCFYNITIQIVYIICIEITNNIQMRSFFTHKNLYCVGENEVGFNIRECISLIKGTV